MTFVKYGKRDGNVFQTLFSMRVKKQDYRKQCSRLDLNQSTHKNRYSTFLIVAG